MLLCYIFPSVSLFLSLPPKCISHFHFFYAYLIMTQGWGPAAGGIRQSYKSKWVNRLAYHFCRHLSVQWSHYSICLCVTVVFAHTCSIFFFFVSLFVKTKTSKKYHNIFLLNFLWTHLWRNKLGVTVQSTIRFQEINPRWLVWLHTKSVDEHGSGDSPAFRFGRCGLFFLETAVWFFCVQHKTLHARHHPAHEDWVTFRALCTSLKSMFKSQMRICKFSPRLPRRKCSMNYVLSFRTFLFNPTYWWIFLKSC